MELANERRPYEEIVSRTPDAPRRLTPIPARPRFNRKQPAIGVGANGGLRDGRQAGRGGAQPRQY